MRLLDRKTVAERLDVSPRTLDRMVAAGEFPIPVRICNRPKWPVEVVDRWFDEKVRLCLGNQVGMVREGRCA